MKIWVDDVRPAPSQDWLWFKTVDGVKVLLNRGQSFSKIEIMSLDHDAGEYQECGGDYIEILNWLEEQCYLYNLEVNFPIHLHTMNPIGRENMRRIIEHNGWKEVY